MKKIFNRFLQEINKIRFNYTAMGILNTPPIEYKYDNKVVIVSMVGHSTVNMYLIAIKSFILQFGYGSIEVINDGSLTKEDIDIVSYHVPDITFFDAVNVDTLTCPTYISWKRLLRIAELAKKSYVIQLDSDTVSSAPLVDIHNKVQENNGFLIGSDRWAAGVDVDFLYNIVRYWKNNHVQARAEEVFKDIEFFSDGTKYLRACAGFCGYPKNFASTSEIENLSSQIEEKIGKKWHEWGSEQTATMCLISKTPNASVLPWPKYQNYMEPLANDSISSASFVHFIGSNRYKKRIYRKLLQKTLKNIG